MTRTVKGFSPRTRSLLVVLPFLFVILLLDVSSMYNMSRTIDERRHVKFGKNIIERTLSGPSSQRMPITMLNYLPSRVTASLHLDLTKKTEDFLSRLPSVLTSLLLALFVFRWSDRLYGTRGATLSLALYTFCPTILAHSRVATTDIYCACFMLISLYCFTAYLKRPGPATLIVAAIVTGIAQVTKSTALLLFPLYVILWLINLLYVKDRLGPARLAPSRASIARGTVRAVVFLCIVALMINVAYLFQGSCAPLGESIERFRVESVESSEAKSDQVFNKIISLS
jgi:predicted membrane-bound mannosyltransferase